MPWQARRKQRKHKPFEVRLPRRWPHRAKSGVLHALGVARWILATLRGGASADDRGPLELEDTRAHVKVLLCENKLLRGRLASIPAAKRPHYQAEARMEIVQLRAAQGWTLEQTAARFLVTAATLATWMRRVDEQGPEALVRRPPANKYPELVTQMVSTLGYVAPMLGTKRVAQWLAGLGLVLSASTVRRRKQQKPAAPPTEMPSETPKAERFRMRVDAAKTAAESVAVTDAAGHRRLRVGWVMRRLLVTSMPVAYPCTRRRQPER